MTERLYYHDSELLDFDAQVTAVLDNGRQVVLNRTAFYPTSGGQPYDTGFINEYRVTDVVDADDHIVHLLDPPFSGSVGDTVHGTVNWERRFDHMQQHTGQHLLSALLADSLGMPTVSVHFGDHSSSIDVSAPASDNAPDEQWVEALERSANELIAANLTVSVAFEDVAQATGLRKASDRSGTIRIVSIGTVDRSACGGTHVSQTGQIGSVLLRRIERTKGLLRVEFLCGMRAVRASRSDFAILQDTSKRLSASVADIPTLVEGMQLRVRTLERLQRQLEESVATFRAQEMWNNSSPVNSLRRIHISDLSGTPRNQQPLAVAITKLGSAVVLVTGSLEPPYSFLLATSDDSAIDAGATVKKVLAEHEGRGGGSPRVAQGSVSNRIALDAIADAIGCTLN